MEKFATVAVIHVTTAGIEVVTRVRTTEAEAYAETLRVEPFIDPKSVRVRSILPANKARLLALAG